jgi:archaellum component FlaG (FlaF/FlaG flagellin family)
MTYPYSSRNKQIVILIAVSAIALLVGVMALNTVLLQNVGNVQAIDIEIYWDSNHTDKVSLVDWGLMEPGTAKNVTFYIMNTGNSDVMLSKDTTNWSSQNASNYITLSWDYNGQRISPGQVLKTTLTLAMSPDIQGITQFSFDMVVTGSE